MNKTIQVRAIPNAGKNEVKKINGGLKIYVTAPPAGGKANKALLEVLAGYLGLKKSQLRIVKGGKSKDKIIEIISVVEEV